jgi:hypothetical protein
VQVPGQLAELLGAGDVELVVAIQDEHHGASTPRRLLDGIAHQLGVGVEQGRRPAARSAGG